MEKLNRLIRYVRMTVINSQNYTVFQKTCDHIFDDKLK